MTRIDGLGFSIGAGLIALVMALSATRSPTLAHTQWAQCGVPDRSAMAANVDGVVEAVSGNLLINPDFENGYTLYPGHNNIQVPVGWNIRWYTDTPPGGDPRYPFKQPEVHVINSVDWPFCCAPNIPPRIHAGQHAIEAGTNYAPVDVAWYQSVGHIPIGAVVTASAWLHAWTSSCNPFPTSGSPLPAISLQGGNVADSCPDNFWLEDTNHMLVGIDPGGGTDPRASSVVWNWNEAAPPWWGPYDYYSNTVPAVAVAQAHTVTLFMRGVTVQPTRYDVMYFDTASWMYSFPISASSQVDGLWPLPVTATVTVQTPVSLTQVNAVTIDPNGASLPVTLTDTSLMSSTYTSQWRFEPASEGRHVFTLTADELTAPIVQVIDIPALRTAYVQDYLLPRDSLTPTNPVLITFTVFSLISLTNVTTTLTDPLGVSLPITLVATDYVTPTYDFQWQFTPIVTGVHTLSLNADEFTQLLVRAILAASERLYLPIVLRNSIGP